MEESPQEEPDDVWQSGEEQYNQGLADGLDAGRRRQVCEEIRTILWPDNPDAPRWSFETCEAIAEVLTRLGFGQPLP
jgi:hypothetical protein